MGLGLGLGLEDCKVPRAADEDAQVSRRQYGACLLVPAAAPSRVPPAQAFDGVLTHHRQ